MSAEILRWHLTRSMPALCFLEFHSVAVHSRASYTLCSLTRLCPLKSDARHWKVTVRAVFQNNICSNQMTEFCCRLQRHFPGTNSPFPASGGGCKRATDTGRRIVSLMRQDFSQERTLNVSPRGALMQTGFQAQQPSRAQLVPERRLSRTGHSTCIVGCQCRPNRLTNTVLQEQCCYWSTCESCSLSFKWPEPRGCTVECLRVQWLLCLSRHFPEYTCFVFLCCLYMLIFHPCHIFIVSPSIFLGPQSGCLVF